jgi:hypothetical protein
MDSPNALDGLVYFRVIGLRSVSDEDAGYSSLTKLVKKIICMNPSVEIVPI